MEELLELFDQEGEPDSASDTSDSDGHIEPHEDYHIAEAILQNLYGGRVSVQVAAEQLATLAFKRGEWHEGTLSDWTVITHPAKRSTVHHEILAELLCAIANLPPEKDEQGRQRMLYPGSMNGKFWEDLPHFAMNMREEWRTNLWHNGGMGPRGRIKIQGAIRKFININKFAAQLRLTEHPVFKHYEWWALVSMRCALEYHKPEEMEAWLPAALIWVSMLGKEMYFLDNEYESGPRIGDRGKGGPLWDGKGQHGFCRERWELWRCRFWALSEDGSLAEEVRGVAREGFEQMVEVERLATDGH